MLLGRPGTDVPVADLLFPAGGGVLRNARRLDECHPALAEHLRASVSTGSTCRYDPLGPTHWAR